jgi:hypothetical protein
MLYLHIFEELRAKNDVIDYFCYGVVTIIVLRVSSSSLLPASAVISCFVHGVPPYKKNCNIIKVTGCKVRSWYVWNDKKKHFKCVSNWHRHINWNLSWVRAHHLVQLCCDTKYEADYKDLCNVEIKSWPLISYVKICLTCYVLTRW